MKVFPLVSFRGGVALAAFLMDYTNALPNFVCTVITRRSVDKTGRTTWKQQDLITELLRYVDGNEDHHILQVNAETRSADKDPMTNGVHSDGEFGLFLDAVFSQKAAAHFDWQGFVDVNGTQTQAYRYEVPLRHSLYALAIKNCCMCGKASGIYRRMRSSSEITGDMPVNRLLSSIERPSLTVGVPHPI